MFNFKVTEVGWPMAFMLAIVSYCWCAMPRSINTVQMLASCSLCMASLQWYACTSYMYTARVCLSITLVSDMPLTPLDATQLSCSVDSCSSIARSEHDTPMPVTLCIADWAKLHWL
jgi:hypothetical protein